ncbi:DUF4956 domain-containing protein [Butyrivibrio sp. WCD2001]|uniref:DUF4956 domain-containing protein n=1 Tax=Butyrivibrio sp. WCD2001 TaxID=1280681 RepID=UPI00041C2CF0|nr:DUF4956 domain-containing protein [Butyrivibrio sp. WCD2001]
MEKIFKKSFLEGYASVDITVESVVLALAITFLIGLYIFFVYRVVTRKTFYSKNFNISLVGVALITSAIIVTIQSSVVVSLGMVGALSIVRFRTAIKDPMDLMFLFWSISVGIICGAGFAIFAVLLSAAITVTILGLDWLPVAKAPMILVINCTDIDAEEKIMSRIKNYVNHFSIKSRNLTTTSLDLTVELRTENGGKLVRDIIDVDGVTSANLLQHNGEVTF